MRRRNDFWFPTLPVVLAMGMRGSFAMRIAAWLSLVPLKFGQSSRDFDSRAKFRVHKLSNGFGLTSVPKCPSSTHTTSDRTNTMAHAPGPDAISIARLEVNFNRLEGRAAAIRETNTRIATSGD